MGQQQQQLGARWSGGTRAVPPLAARCLQQRRAGGARAALAATARSSPATHKSSLSSWERKHKEFQRARDMQERALQDKIHASDLQISKLEQEATGHLDAAALLEELEVVRSQRGQLEISNNDQAMEIRRLKERVEQLEEERSGANPLLLPSAQQQQPSTADSAFFLTGAQPTGQAQAQAQTGPQAGAGGFAEFVQLKKENKSLKAQLQQLQRKGAPMLTGPSKGVAPGSLL